MLCLLLLPFLAAAALADDQNPVHDVIRKAGFGLDIEQGVISAVGILTGFIFCFYGKRLFKFSLFLAGLYFFGVSTYLALTNGQNVIDLGENRSSLILIISSIAGICGGVLAVWLYKLGIYLIGAIGGFFCSLWILSIMGSSGQALEGTWRALFIIAFVLVGIIATIKTEKHVIIVGTATAGSFAMVLGADSYINTGFLQLVMALIGGDPFIQSSISPSIYGMIVTTAMLTIIGMVVQYKRADSISGK